MAKTNNDKAKEYERLGRQLEALYDAINPKKGALYKTAFLKGILGGVGGVIGATLVIALLLWVLSLFDSVPFVGPITHTVQKTIERK